MYYGGGNKIWPDEKSMKFLGISKKWREGNKEKPIFDKFLLAMECKWETGVFRSVDLEYIRGKDSLFSFLYCNGWDILRMERGSYGIVCLPEQGYELLRLR